MGNRPGSAPEGRDIVAEASAWFAEFREGDVPAATRARFDEWLRRSPEHIQAYLEVSAAWSELPTGDPEGRIDVTALLARARESADDNVVAFGARGEDAGPRGLARGPLTPRRRSLPALAASIAFALMLLGLTAWLVAFRADTYSTGVGEQRTVRLADGSTVELNALSSIRARLSKTLRDIELTRGQALFHVAKDRARPFIVQSEGVTVRAVGTQFDVYRKRNGTTVTVLEGEVAVVPGRDSRTEPKEDSAPSILGSRGRAPDPQGAAADEAAGANGATILVSAGEQVTVTPHEVQKRHKADVAAATAWVEQRLIFEATPLSDVADEFNRYNTRKLVIADPALRSVGISGVYSTADPASLVGFLRSQPNLQVTETQTEIRLTRGEKR
jgi:transmembrane sensor